MPLGREVTGGQQRGHAVELDLLSQGNAQREAQAAREAQQQLVLVQSEVRRLEGELDTARRERDALQLEMSLVQVRGWRGPEVAVGLRPRDLLGVMANAAIFYQEF